jgi:hypothetical protein
MGNKFSRAAQKLGAIHVHQSKAHFNYNNTPYRSFSDFFTDKSDLYNLLSRSDLKGRLKELSSKQHTGGEWIGTKSQMEYLAGLDRDYRNRMRTRLDISRSAALGSNFIKMSMTKYSTKIDTVLS